MQSASKRKRYEPAAMALGRQSLKNACFAESNTCRINCRHESFTNVQFFRRLQPTGVQLVSEGFAAKANHPQIGQFFPSSFV
jgi:triphosphoribosyl-dephospho-CoA synthetase